MFLGGIEVEHWLKMDYCLLVIAFYRNVALLCLLKTSENRRFQGVQKCNIGLTWIEIS